jgi:hypothetical protein
MTYLDWNFKQEKLELQLKRNFLKLYLQLYKMFQLFKCNNSIFLVGGGKKKILNEESFKLTVDIVVNGCFI